MGFSVLTCPVCNGILTEKKSGNCPHCGAYPNYEDTPAMNLQNHRTPPRTDSAQRLNDGVYIQNNYYVQNPNCIQDESGEDNAKFVRWRKIFVVFFLSSIIANIILVWIIESLPDDNPFYKLSKIPLIYDFLAPAVVAFLRPRGYIGFSDNIRSNILLWFGFGALEGFF